MGQLKSPDANTLRESACEAVLPFMCVCCGGGGATASVQRPARPGKDKKERKESQNDKLKRVRDTPSQAIPMRLWKAFIEQISL